MTAKILIVALADMQPGQEADLFVLMIGKEQLLTKDGKPYWRVGFRDARREVSFPIWADSPWADDCRQHWQPGAFYKLRAEYRETNFGPQLEIRKIRAAVDDDRADGFDPLMCQPRSRFEPKELFDELLRLAHERIADVRLRALVIDLFKQHRAALLTLPAASRNHHAFVGGFLEHVRSVVQTAVFLADKYEAYYPELRLDKDLVVAGALLHDIGKLRELEQRPEGAAYTPEGHLIGHILQGRDMLREAAAGRDIDGEKLLRLEHIIVSHQRLPEWGSPKPPMTPEALLVHYADDLDAKYAMVAEILRQDTTPGEMTSKKNVLRQAIYRGRAPSGDGKLDD